MFGFLRRIINYFRAEMGGSKPLLERVMFWRKPPSVEKAKPDKHPPEEPAPPLPRPKPDNRPDAARRAEMKRLEKARKKYDKFVAPKGDLPPPKARKEKEDKGELVELPTAIAAAPLPALEDIDGEITLEPRISTGNFYIEERYHSTGEKVYYDESEFYGEFNFRDTILDQLELYWRYLNRMRKHDPESYSFYRLVGATLIPYATYSRITYRYARRRIGKSIAPYTSKQIEELKANMTLSSWFNETRPAFGCVCTSNAVDEMKEAEPDARNWYIPKFFYFHKYKLPPETLQPVKNGDVYKLTIWWDTPSSKQKGNLRKGGIPSELGLFVSRDGKTIRMLKTLARHDGYWRTWQYDKWFLQWAKDLQVDPHLFFGEWFCEVTRKCEAINYSTCRVSVVKGDTVAVFGVAMDRMPYFFSDRDIELTKGGVRKRIFHSVRPHMRGDKAMPMTFRGVRDFDWAGYRVHITVPGLDHIDPQELNMGVYDIDRVPRHKRSRLITDSKFAELLSERIREAWK